MNKALLVIDIQPCYLELNATKESAQKLIDNANVAIAKAEAQGIPIVFIKHYFDSFIEKIFFKTFFKGAGLRGMPKSEFDPRLKVAGGLVLEKTTENTFASTHLEKLLKDQGVNELYILGQDGVACINKTTRGALDLGFKVHLVSDAIVSGAPKKWEKLQSEFAKKPNCDFVRSF